MKSRVEKGKVWPGHLTTWVGYKQLAEYADPYQRQAHSLVWSRQLTGMNLNCRSRNCLWGVCLYMCRRTQARGKSMHDPP